MLLSLVLRLSLFLATIFGVFARPNVVFILTDDQDVTLGGLTPMTKALSFFGENGVTFTNAFTTIPICCPSRSSILTGMYQHNHHVYNNSKSGNCYGDEWRDELESNTFVTYLHQFNYTTFYAGKYLNQYGVPPDPGLQRVPAGWDNWNGLLGNSKYYNYTLSVNGIAEWHGQEPEDYLTDLINVRALDFLRNQNDSDTPFFMMLGTPSAHAPFTPSVKYTGTYANVTAPRTPNYNITGGPTKHWLLRQTPEHLPDDTIGTIDSHYRNRWATLLSVDDMFQNVLDLLREQQKLESTYIFLASDNGFHFGQFSLPWDKRQMYEFDIRIPLMVYGPGVTPGAVRTEPVVTIDFAPTFLELAGLTVPSNMDGSSLLPLLRDEGGVAWRSTFLVEYHGEWTGRPDLECPQYMDGNVSQCKPDCICEDARNNTYTCVRTLTQNESLIYCLFEDSEAFVEMYNLNDDQYQLDNLAVGNPDRDVIDEEYEEQLRNLRSRRQIYC